MSLVGETIRYEIRELLPTVIYFVITLNIIGFPKVLLLRQNGMTVSTFVGASKRGIMPSSHHLIYRPLTAMHRGHHALKEGVEKCPGVFMVTVGEQLHRPFQVGKEHRDLLALAFEGGFG